MALPLVEKWKVWDQYSDFTALLERAYLRRFARTSKGYFCLVPAWAKKGGFVGLFEGGRNPLVLREYGEYWRLVGESYVRLMNGEAWYANSDKEVLDSMILCALRKWQLFNWSHEWNGYDLDERVRMSKSSRQSRVLSQGLESGKPDLARN